MANNLIVLVIVSLLSKLLGFVREVIFSYFYGAGEITDAYLMASSSSGIFLGALATLSVVHTPIYQELKIKESKRRAEQYTNQISLLVLGIGILGMFFIFLNGTKLIQIVARGFDEEKIQLTLNFFYWAAFSVIVTSINQIFISELNCKGKFGVANVTNCILSIVQGMIAFLSGISGNIFALKYSALLAAVIQLLLLIAVLIYTKHEFFGFIPLKKEINTTFVLAVPIFFSTLMDDINAFVDKMFGSGLPEGRISALNYAHLIKQLFFYVFALTMITIIYPKMAESLAKREREEFNASINLGIEYMIILFSVIMIGIIAFARPMIQIVYGRGSFDDTAVLTTSQALVMYAMALLPLAIREVLIRAFQAMKDTKINLLVGIFSTIVNVFLNFVLIEPLGHMGLALSTAIAAYLTIPVLFYFMVRKSVNIQIFKLIQLFMKTLITAFFTVGIFYYFFYSSILQVENIWLKILYLGFVVVGVCIFYFMGLFLLKVESVRLIVQRVKERVFNR